MALQRLEISIDDGHKDDIAIAELLEDYGLRGIFYVCPLATLVPEMNSTQLKHIAEKHEIGGHTLTHALLTTKPKEVAMRELLLGKQVLEHIIEKPVKRFAYTKGWFNPEVKEWVKEAGFEEARTIKLGVTSLKGYDPYEIPCTAHIYPREEYKALGIVPSVLQLLEKAHQEKEGYFHLVLHTAEIIKYDLWGELELILKVMAVRNQEMKKYV